MSDGPSVTLAEAVQALDVSADMLAILTSGVTPFAPVEGFLSLRQLLGLRVLTVLHFMEVGAAAQIAVTASEGADTENRNLLAVAFVDGAPRVGWVGGVDANLARAVLVLPINRMFSELTARLAHGEAAPVRLVNRKGKRMTVREILHRREQIRQELRGIVDKHADGNLPPEVATRSTELEAEAERLNQRASGVSLQLTIWTGARPARRWMAAAGTTVSRPRRRR